MTKDSLRNYITILVIAFYLIVSALLMLWPIAVYELDAEELDAYRQYSAHFLKAGLPGLLLGITGYLYGRGRNKKADDQDCSE